MMKTTFERKYLKIFLLLFLLPLFSITKTYSQCAGTSNSSFPPICDKKTFTMGANPVGVVDLYSLLGGTPTPGGVWSDLNSSGGLNPATGLLNTWQINRGGIFTYRYRVTSVPGCVAPNNFADVTITLGGYPGVSDPSKDLCINDAPYNLFGSLGSNPNPHNNGTWTGGPPGSLSGSNFNPQIAGLGTYVLTYTVPIIGICNTNLTSTVTVTVQPLPNAGVATPLTFCETDDFSAYTNVDLFNQLAGEDNGGFWTDTNGTGELSGPGDSVINIQNIANTFGDGTYTFTYTVDPSHPVCDIASSSVVITIKPVVDLNGSTLTVAPDICFSEIGTTPIIGTIIQGAIPIPNGTYNITYVLGGANAGTATVPVTFSGGINTAPFTINSAFLTTIGTTSVTITTVFDPSTAPTNCTRTIAGLLDSFIINPNPDPSDSVLNIQNICLGETAIGIISDGGTTPAIQLADGSYTITFTITGPNGPMPGQTAVVTINGGTGPFNILSALTPIDGNYSVVITNIRNNTTNCSSPASIPFSFVVAPIPDAVSISVSIANICDGENVVVNISGATNLTDGFYNITYNISGDITLAGNVQNNVQFTGGTSVPFNLPAGLLVVGQYMLTVTNLFSSSSTCQTTTFTSPSDSYEIHAIPDAGDIIATVADVCLGQSGTVLLFDTNPGVAPELTNGAYSITYNLTGANTTATGQTATVTIASGSPLGTFTIPASLLTNTGITNLVLTIITNTTTGCDVIGVPIMATFEVLEIPLIDAASLSVQPVCQGQSATASISGAGVGAGNYNLTYTITYIPTGVNTVTGFAVAVVFDAAGNTSFNIPITQIPNDGNYTITITNIVDNTTPNACSGPVSGLSATIIVNENPDTSNTTLSATDPVCLGSAGQVTLTDLTGTLSAGTYNIVYELSAPNFATGLTATVTFPTSGSFNIPPGLLTNLGNTTVHISSIANAVTNCTSAADLRTDFDIVPIPDPTSASLTVQDICLGSNATGILTAPNLIVGNSYTLTYNLTGALNSSSANTVSIVYTNPNTSFIIPSTLLTNVENTPITITSITNTTAGAGNCIVPGLNIATSFNINPIPNILATEVTIAPTCIGNSATVSITTGGGLINGNYQINYSISGANGPSTQTANFTIPGGTFNIPSALLTNVGLTTVTFNSVTNTGTTCSNLLGFPKDFMVNPLPNVTPSQFNVDPICLGQNASGNIINATNLVDGSYTILYDLTGANTTGVSQSAILSIVSGAGNFVIPSTILTNTGTTNITITSITNNTTGCTTSPINIPDSFVINPLPDLTGTMVNVVEPICLGSGATANISGSLLADGTYNINYNLTGANTISGTSTVVLVSGSGPFIVQGSELSNAGSYTITITGITNPATLCTGTGSIPPDTFVVNPIPVIVPSEITIADICVGIDASVAINSLGLADGNYDLTYTLSGANTMPAQTVNLTVAGGVTNFTLLAAQLTNTGLTTLNITMVVNTGTTCSNTFTALSRDFNVNPIPTINQGEMTVADVCLGQDAVGTLLNAANLADGTYSITYDLTGLTNNATAQTATVTITGGAGIFYIPAALLTTAETTTITITAVSNTATGCATSGLAVTDIFNVIALPNITGATLTVSDICLASDAEVIIASSLADGTYTIIYDLSGANTSVDNTVGIQITGGASTGFIIPAALLLNAGATTVTVQDLIYDTTLCGANTVSLNPITFTINDPSAPTIAADGNEFCIQDNPTIADLTANVSPSVNITWYNAASGGTAYSATDALAHNTTYYATVTAGACESSTRLEVTVDLTACDDLFIPDGFSPNGDTQNETFIIRDIELLYPEFVLEIYNRYGNMVYKGNIDTAPFDGKPNQTTIIGSDVLPTGVYFYIVHFNDAIGTKPKQGRLYLSR
ncbi:gliding motility-associated C-terminal domain-containing protein [Flavobacterium sp. GT3R68]|uniref:gliding motility-associated C-terminal domain-containing protein n=1 Tax=Flavobacterium sp. GT3R68 TaxID=2594437 RepID=UPI000F861123|nr:gliding motility-associated C-terminal domain-containing protein [Flavobacterium sp. GT3R68]RTY95350.1 gliding motility-associated C-terminal domain-containing protein [Flavobacterium sp. GSN2]TRW90910.1 gliding motility-associated C-terminal domain-containing protein [Flavobacterium sp. GT3R68]